VLDFASELTVANAIPPRASFPRSLPDFFDFEVDFRDAFVLELSGFKESFPTPESLSLSDDELEFDDALDLDDELDFEDELDAELAAETGLGLSFGDLSLLVDTVLRASFCACVVVGDVSFPESESESESLSDDELDWLVSFIVLARTTAFLGDILFGDGVDEEDESDDELDCLVIFVVLV
jgi:hypothetical protein